MEEKFEEIYRDLYEKSSIILKEAKKNKNKKIFIVIALIFIINILIAKVTKSDITILIILSLSILIFLLILHFETEKYRELYKKNIINEIVKKCNKNLYFNPKGKITKSEYTLSKFDPKFDEIISEDLILGNIVKNNYLKIIQIITKEIIKYKDSNGNVKTQKTETFRGMYGTVKLSKNTNSQIYIANNSITKKYSSKRVEMDSIEFEKEYDCLTNDKIIAMKLFTPDIIEKMVDLKKAKLTAFEMKVEEDNLYFRSRCGEMFEPPNFRDPLDKKTIRKYYDTIFLPIDLIENLIKKIELL